MLQWLLVTVLVIGSAAYALWSLLSAKMRLRLLDLSGPTLSSTVFVASLRRRTLAQLAGGCGSCAANAGNGTTDATLAQKNRR